MDVQNEKPDKGEPTMAELFLATRKRKPGRKYTSRDSSTREKIARIEDQLSFGNDERVEEIIGEDTSHGPEFLLGRMGHNKRRKESAECSAAHSTTLDIPEEVLQEIKSKVRAEVREEFRAELDSLKEFKVFVLEKLSLLSAKDVNITGFDASIGNCSTHSVVGEE
ncbi:hypothetical protein M5689_010199 [Euphorbia peplus]|nr:hypothetical protein M5689_010199 [Euphorbia peplus]